MSDWAGDTEEPLGYQVKGPFCRLK